ncbi:hypothetical protein G6L37_32085 [Agrobacterium rubi]|uniref:HEPN domain-containing protein n=1 Tax=Agrobacterium rubi TaxID=28099 RepID=UPI001574C0C6|nr:hypothetical protein [Agrobacterium rubi]NTF23031.1 hypothetical protein [Agrobacterium rubi]NTF29962.1 hypothetical protein [Agrobacterium rubi]
MARIFHPDHWTACARIEGFEPLESRRRGLLATQVALDTIRLALSRPSRGLISTVVDATLPVAINRLSQVDGRDLAHGSRINRRGVSGSPGLAQAILDGSEDLFEAAGACIAGAASIHNGHACPTLAERWLNAVHWFGRACLADVDFVAVVMLVIALDVLSGGLQEKGILELTARLTDIGVSQVVLSDGTTLQKLVAHSYALRSEVAHGSILAVHRQMDSERGRLEDLAAAALDQYVVALHKYANARGSDDRDRFLASLPAAKP